MSTDPDIAFAAVVDALRDEPGVARRRAFGRDALSVGGKVFALGGRGAFVLKLPAERCAQLGRPFESGAGHPMREWVVVEGPPDAARWTELAREALAFVRPAAE